MKQEALAVGCGEVLPFLLSEYEARQLCRPSYEWNAVVSYAQPIGLARGENEELVSTGNYSDIYERNIGPKTPLGLQRGVNAQWTQGGIQYGIPIL